MTPLNIEIRNLLASATNLPADGIVYRTGDVEFCHLPETRIRCEQVKVTRYGVTFRSRFVKGRWQAAEQVSGTVSA
jgi:hypothetical protein